MSLQLPTFSQRYGNLWKTSESTISLGLEWCVAAAVAIAVLAARFLLASFSVVYFASSVALLERSRARVCADFVADAVVAIPGHLSFC